MEFLRLLESIRTPFWNAVMQIFTYCGEELVFLVVALAVFWCVSKRKGYYILAVGFFGTLLSQFMKLMFRIPRPWVQDPKFTIVESARAGAGGYSFPSGHAQSAAGTFGAIACYTKKAWLRWGLIALTLLVCFSRMYLGVHTPLDVGVGFAISAVLVFVLYPIMLRGEEKPRTMKLLLASMLACCAAYMLIVNLCTFPADLDMENYTEVVKNGYSLLGALLGLCLTYTLDEKKLHFDVRAPLPGQILKVVLGLLCLLGIRTGLKALFALFGNGLYWNAVRYFIMVLFAGGLWPLTFPLFQKLGRKPTPAPK